METLTRQNAVKDDFYTTNIDECIAHLIECREQGKSVYVDFAGQRLYSCDATVNNIYIQVLGKTKEEYDADNGERVVTGNMSADNRKKWMEIAEGIIYPQRMAEWQKCIESTHENFGHGDLESIITAMQMLNGGASFENVASYIKGLGTYGRNSSMIESMILNFSKRGPEYFEYVKGEPENIDENTAQMISRIKSQNKEYETTEILDKKGEGWRNKAAKLVYPERMPEWERIMRLRVAGEYKGSELDLALGAMELLDKGVSFDNVERYIEEKSSTARQAEMADIIILNFSKKGPDYFSYSSPDREQELVAQLKTINGQLSERYAETAKAQEARQRKIAQLGRLAGEKRDLQAELKTLEIDKTAEGERETKGKEMGE